MSQFRKPMIRKSQEAGTRIKGRFTEGVKVETTIQASIQPANPTEIETLPEGRRNEETFRVYTSTKMNTELDDKNSDSIIYNDIEYEIIKRMSWQNSVINHYKYLVQKLGDLI